jgi:delta24-sterol reductase
MADLQTPLVRRKRKKVLVDYLVQFRWILVIFVVLPFSALIYLNIYLGDMWSAMKSEKRRQKEHEENVDKVVKRLKQRNPKKDGLVCTARKPWIAVGMRNVDYKRARHFEVDLSAFRNILAGSKVSGPLDVAVPQGRGHIRSRSHWKKSQEKPIPDKNRARTKTLALRF